MDASPAIDEIRELLTRHIDTEWRIYEDSLREERGATYLLARRGREKMLVVSTEAKEVSFTHEAILRDSAERVFLCPCSAENARLLREEFPWTGPIPLGKAPVIGCGDRLGVATPGHIRACRQKGARPVLAQQSIREMERTGRSPQEVIDDVTWSVFQEGYTEGYGADADHLKTPEDIDRCVETGYTMYTIDPSDHVDNEADHLGDDELTRRFEGLPWDTLGLTAEKYLDRYASDSIVLESEAGTLEIDFGVEELKRAAVKYSAAIAHTSTMADHLARRYAADRPGEEYDLEMSVDETDQPTHPREHYFVAAELERLGVEVTSLAPRFVGDFEKGIDFIGDPDHFEATLKKHVIILQAFGGYKLSVHSGSDKFTVFPILGRQAGPKVHLKTAGTSYLEALRIPARHAPDFFREIVDYAFERFEADRKTYHVSTDLDAIPTPGDVDDADLEATYLDENNGRQLLHITYGSVLTAKQDGGWRFKDRFLEFLNEHEEDHFDTLENHFRHHIESVGTLAQ